MRIIIIPTLQEKAEAWRDYRYSNFFLPVGASNLLFWFNNDALLTVLLRNKIGWVKKNYVMQKNSQNFWFQVWWSKCMPHFLSLNATIKPRQCVSLRCLKTLKMKYILAGRSGKNARIQSSAGLGGEFTVSFPLSIPQPELEVAGTMEVSTMVQTESDQEKHSRSGLRRTSRFTRRGNFLLSGAAALRGGTKYIVPLTPTPTPPTTWPQTWCSCGSGEFLAKGPEGETSELENVRETWRGNILFMNS